MKNYKELQADINKYTETYRSLKKQYHEIFIDAPFTKSSDPKLEEFKKISAELQEKQFKTRLAYAYTLSNLRYVEFLAVADAIEKTSIKFEGKPYGEKTRTKFAQEVSSILEAEDSVPNANNIWCNLGDDEIKCYNLRQTYYSKSRAMFLIHNKIQHIKASDLVLMDSTNVYYDDIDKCIQDYEKALEAIKSANATLSEACENYNKIRCSGMDSAYFSLNRMDIPEIQTNIYNSL